MRVLLLTAWMHINIVRRRFANLIILSGIYGTKLYAKQTVVPEQYGITFPLHSSVLRFHAHRTPLVFRSSILVSLISLFYSDCVARPSGVDTCAHTRHRLER
jgi:hypothetical protein